MTRNSRRSVGWLTLLVGAILVLRSSATGDLTSPPLTSLDALSHWTDTREPATAAIALVRFAAELVAWYLLGLTTLYGLAAGLRSGGMAALADALAAPGAGRLVRSGLGLGLLASTAAVAATTQDDVASGAATATMQPVQASGDEGTAWMVPVVDEAPTPAATPTTTPTTPTTTSANQTTWTVSEGESFWTIAEDVLEAMKGHAPTDAEIDPYWRSLIEANRNRLVDRDDPDLIHPGQVFEIPAP